MSLIERNLVKQPDLVRRTVTEAELTAKLASESVVVVEPTPRKRHALAAPTGPYLNSPSANVPNPALGSQNLVSVVRPQLKASKAYPGSPQIRHVAVSCMH